MFFRRSVFWFIAMEMGLFLAVTGDAQEAATVPEDPANFHLFLLAGQSNMAGRGKVEAEDQQPHPRVLMLDEAGKWVPAVDPLHFDKPQVVGVGLGRTFAMDYAKANPEITVGLLPCAVGGSPISSWQPGGYHSQTKSHPYDDAIKRARRATKSGVLKGVLWHQGESDSKPALSSAYEQKLHELVARLRRDLNSPDLPFVAGQMGRFAGRPWDEHRRRVDAAHASLPEKVARTAVASSDGLTDRNDKVHFDSRSYRELGHRYYRAFASIAEASKH